jgi:hypothetical protein
MTDAHDDEPVTFVGCDCDHQPEEHSWGGCMMDGCDCDGAWEE